MIPKKIHYCWFGRGEMNKKALMCINSWKKYCPDYELIEWNEDNYDVYQNAYTSYLYNEKKYAFLSDYVRLQKVYEEGGIYFDVDVEVIKSFDDLLNEPAFFGFETDEYVNTGVGFGAEKHNEAVLAILKEYEPYLDGKHGYKGCPILNTEGLVKQGLIRNGKIQRFDTFTVFPQDYFNPYDDPTGTLNTTYNTYSIHWYAKSWLPMGKRVRSMLTKPVHKAFGIDVFKKPYMKAGFNYLHLLFKGKQVEVTGTPLFSYNSKIQIHKTGHLKLGNRVISDGRFVLIIDKDAEVSIGNYVYFNEDCMISSKCKIVIGDHCQFGPGVKIFDNNHKYSAEKGVSNEHTSAPVTIGENSWIGANVTILKGTQIGKNCVIGAGCVVRGNIPDGQIVSQKDNLVIKPIKGR